MSNQNSGLFASCYVIYFYPFTGVFNNCTFTVTTLKAYILKKIVLNFKKTLRDWFYFGGTKLSFPVLHSVYFVTGHINTV